MANDKYVSPYSGEQIDRAYEMVRQIATNVVANHGKMIYVDNAGLLQVVEFEQSTVAALAYSWGTNTVGKFLIKDSSGNLSASSYDQNSFILNSLDDAPRDGSQKPVTSEGIYRAIQDVREVAEGKTANYVISDAVTGTNIVNSSFNNNADLSFDVTFDNNTIIRTTMVDSNNQPIDIKLKDLKIGDIISVTETTVPDRWVGGINNTTHKITFYALEIKLNTTSTVANGSAALVTSGGVYTFVTTGYQPKGNYVTTSDAQTDLVWVNQKATTINAQSSNDNWAGAAAVYSAITDGTVGTFQTWTFTVKNNDNTTSDVNVKLRVFPTNS